MTQATQREMQRAHWMVRQALKDGTLKQLPCEVCGAVNSEAHHEDYSKPLEVKWLCKQDHHATDRRFKKRHGHARVEKSNNLSLRIEMSDRNAIQRIADLHSITFSEAVRKVIRLGVEKYKAETRAPFSV